VRIPAEAGLESLVSVETGAPLVMKASPSFVEATHWGAGGGAGLASKCCRGPSPTDKAIAPTGSNRSGSTDPENNLRRKGENRKGIISPKGPDLKD
jgi:hypothetical protein